MAQPSGELVRRHVVVSGRVQGVFFRDACRREARARGVAGWVRNRPDRTVEAVFEGPAGAVEEMVDWVHRGPERASVSRVDVAEQQPEGERGFRVR